MGTNPAFHSLLAELRKPKPRWLTRLPITGPDDHLVYLTQRLQALHPGAQVDQAWVQEAWTLAIELRLLKT